MFLDTSGLLCYLDRGDSRHAEAARVFNTSIAFLTHSYVLAEFIPLCWRRGFERTVVLTYLEDLVDNPQVEVAWVDEALHRSGMALLRARPDKGYSLCDAVSFVLMRQRGIVEALTTDQHFDQEGFARLLPQG